MSPSLTLSFPGESSPAIVSNRSSRSWKFIAGSCSVSSEAPPYQKRALYKLGGRAGGKGVLDINNRRQTGEASDL